MSRVKVLDVTLRDGGYRNDFGFTQEYAQSMVASLADAGIPYCEVGYCNGSFVRKAEHGLTSAVPADFIERLYRLSRGKIGLAVMVHPRNVVRQDLERLKQQGVAMIRVCLRRDQLADGLNTIAQARELGFIVCANVTHITTQTLSAVIDTSLRAEGAGANILCYADSNGNMIPADVERLFSRLSNRVMLPLGFHAHNNLSLALANAAAAIEAGAEYIDTSLCGMGKGAGNLHLSMLVAYLDRLGLKHGYDLVRILELSQATARDVPRSDLPSPLLEIQLGAYNFPYDVNQRIQETLARFQLSSEFQAVQVMHEQEQVARFAPRSLSLNSVGSLALAAVEGNR